MRFVPLFLRRVIHEARLRRRFPHSVIHAGATADSASILGDFSVLFRNTRLVESTLGAYSYVQKNSALYNVEVGPFCSIAGNVTVGLVNHPTFMVSTSPVFYDNTQPLPRFFSKETKYPHKQPRTVIEADVWIGEGARVRAGVRVGVGAVIGAGAVVTRDIPPYTIAVGVPCRPLRRRFDEAMCQRLVDSRWWELSDQKLTALTDSFTNPEVFLDVLKQQK